MLGFTMLPGGPNVRKVLTGPGYCVCKCWRISIMRLLKFDVVEGRGQQAMKKLRDAALRESWVQPRITFRPGTEHSKIISEEILLTPQR
jgi:hypothetical protein